MISAPEKLEKRNIVEVEEAELHVADSSKRQNPDGQDGYKQLGLLGVVPILKGIS